ncbi:MAG: hypothetical protein FJ388_01615, partial [Verrucomicrobia bacterium]|nr:hypothetical protein [Verrucomicrobiota bacterium]
MMTTEQAFPNQTGEARTPRNPANRSRRGCTWAARWCLLAAMGWWAAAPAVVRAQAVGTNWFWTSSAAGGLWSGGFNWTNELLEVDGPNPFGATNYIINFAASGAIAPYNDLGAFLLNRLVFAGPSVLLSGDQLRFSGNLPQLIQDSAQNIEIYNNIELTAASSNITFGGFGSGDIMLRGAISGGGRLTLLGGYTVTVTNVNTYSGGTTLSNGTLYINRSTSLGSGGTLVFGGGTLRATNIISASQSGQFASYAVFDIDSGSQLTLSGAFSGAGGVVSSGPGTVGLFGANSFIGDTFLNNGTVYLNQANSLGGNNINAWVIFNGGALRATGNFVSVMRRIGFVDNGIFDIDGGSTMSLMTNTTGIGITGAGALIKQGAGTLRLFADTNIVINNYTGGTAVSNGNLYIQADVNLGASAPLILDGGALQAVNNFTLIGRPVSLGAGSGGFNIDANSTLTVTDVVAGVGGLIKTGPGTLLLTALNTYSGGTAFSNGNVYISDVNNLGAPNTLTFGGGALQVTNNLVLNGYLVTLNLGGGIFNVDPGSSLTVNDVVSGPGGLISVGRGTLILNAANAYTGGTAISNGTVYISAENNLGGPETLTLGSNGTLRVTNSFTFINRPVTLNTAVGGGFNMDLGSTLTITNVVSGIGSLTLTGSGMLVLSATNTYGGGGTTGTYINGGTLYIGEDLNLGSNIARVTIGAGTLRVTNSFETLRPFFLTNAGSTIGVDGGSTYILGGIVTNAVTNASLIKIGTGALVLTNATSIAYLSNGVRVLGGSLTLSNSRVSVAGGINWIQSNSVMTLMGSGMLAGTGTSPLFIASNGNGVLIVQDNAVMSNRLVVGSTNSVGAVYLRGGTLFNLATAAAQSSFGTGGESFGYLEITGGVMTN